MACRFTDKPHEKSFIERDVNVSNGSGQALLAHAWEAMPAERPFSFERKRA